ncbi:MAG: hypothetical protein KIG60_00430 [Caryophanon sp.]|nr:hypothetical protein [Caryophanon sp.]
MIRKLISVVVVVVFGWVVYGLVEDYKEDALSLYELATEEASDDTEPMLNGKPIEVTPKEQVDAVKGAATNVEELAYAFYSHMRNWETKFTIEFVGDTTNLGDMLDEAYALAKARDGYVLGHLDRMNLTYEYTTKKATITVLQKYLTDTHQEAFVDQQVSRILPTIVTDAMSDEEKVLAVNDYIVRNTIYGTATEASPHSAFAVLMEGQAVCQGYALVAYKMIDLLGIDVKYVTGEADGIGHAWNLVQLNGVWKHLDTTWNDPVPDRGDKVSRDYALLSDEQMMETHTWLRADYPKAN